METTGVSNTQNRFLKKRRPSPKFIQNHESNKERLISCGSNLIYHTLMMIMKNRSQEYDILRVYMDELLHSIFFFGHIYDSFLAPAKFFKNPKALENVEKEFPEPFKKYKSHLPSRTPFSILLHMMMKLHCTEEKIIKELLILLKKLKFPDPLHKPGCIIENYYTLESTVICVCYSDNHPQKYYGASLSCRKRNAKRIMIDASCLKTWHEFVSHAVMSFTQVPQGDGITFPASVKCQAYYRDWNNNVYKERRPCLYCKQLFNLEDADSDKKPDHPYGNCAETECLSKLLHNNQYIRENTRMENHTEEELERLRGLTKTILMKELGKVGINMSNENILFYSPN